MRTTYLYPAVKVIGRDFSKVPVNTIPNQSMTLKEIIKRFLKREPVPTLKEGYYQEGMGDLEKMRHEDLSVIHERAVESARLFRKAKAEADAKAKAEAEAQAKAVFDAAVNAAVESRNLKPQTPQGP